MRRRSFTLQLPDYKINCLIHVGNQTEVYKVTNLDGELQFAKCLPKTDPHSLIEYDIMKQMNHKYVVETRNMLETDIFYVLLGPYYNSLCLNNYKSIPMYTNQRFAALTYKILVGLKYIHEHKIIHGDIRPENIIISTTEEYDTPHIIDFGFSRYENSEFDPKLITPAYSAPEVIAGGSNSYESDIYSLGLSVYVSYAQLKSVTQVRKKNLFNEKEWKDCNPKLIDLISQMVEPDINTRLTIDQCLNHPYFMDEIEENLRNEILQN